MQTNKAKLEVLLLCLLFGQLAFFFVASWKEAFYFNIYGPTLPALTIVSTVALIYLYLIWGLFNPTLRVLAVGAIFCAAGIIQVAWPTGAWGWSVGLTIDLKLFELGNAVVSMNIVNLILCVLFLRAHRNRKASAKVTAA